MKGFSHRYEHAGSQGVRKSHESWLLVHSFRGIAHSVSASISCISSVLARGLSGVSHVRRLVRDREWEFLAVAYLGVYGGTYGVDTQCFKNPLRVR